MRRDETGSVTVAILSFVVVFVAFAGLLYDGGQRMNARQRAIGEAEAAARYGLRSISVSHATGELVLDPATARRDVDAYLQLAGHEGSALVDGTRVTVTVRVVWNARLFPFRALLSGPVSGTATADPVVGVVGAGR